MNPTLKWIAHRLLGPALLGASLAAQAQSPSALPQPNLQLFGRGTVLAVAYAADGSIVLGGSFIGINGAARTNIAKLGPDGTLDPGWTCPVNGSVSAIAIDAGAIFVGGSIAVGNAPTRYGIAKCLLSGTGGLDPA